MASVNKTALKGYFNAGDEPTEANFVDVFDSLLSLHADDDQTVAGATIFSDVTTFNGGITNKGFTKGTATAAISVADSGKTIIVGPLAAGLAADSIFTLPTAANGLFYRFLYVGGAVDVQDFQVNTGSDTNFFIGGVAHFDTDTDDTDGIPDAVYGNNSSNSRVNILVPDAGTHVECYCDGTNWFLFGNVNSATAPTYADQ